MALTNVLANIPGLAGYLGMQQFQQQQALGGLQGAMGVLNAVQRHEAAQREAQEAPYRIQAMQAQAQMAQQKAADDAARARFFTRENMEAIGAVTPGRPAVAPGAGATGGLDSGALGQILGTGPTESGAPAAAPGQEPGFNYDRLLAAGVQHGMFNPEAIAARQMQQQARQDALTTRLLEIQARSEDRNLDRASRERLAAEANELKRMMYQGQMDFKNAMAAFGRGGGGGGGADGRLDPFKYSVGGENQQGWRDRAGNVYDSSRQPIDPRTIKPEITAADQGIARKNAEEQEAISVVRSQLSELERLANSNPRSVAGPLSGVTRGVESVASTILPGSVGLQATTAQQLIRSVIGNLPKTGRISNYQQQEMRRLFEDGLSGNADSLKKGISLLRQNLEPREAAVQTPTGRATPGGGEVDFNSLPSRRQ